MRSRRLVAEKLGRLLSVLSHPHRILIVEELGDGGERDVASLQHAIGGISHSGVSQHLAQLRLHALVVERREGRHVHYRLVRPELAAWVADSLRFIEPPSDADAANLRTALRQVRNAWMITSSSRLQQSDDGMDPADCADRADPVDEPPPSSSSTTE